MRSLILLFGLLFFSLSIYSQKLDDSKIQKVAKNGLKYYLDSDSSAFFTFGIGLQLWYRYSDLNEGTIDSRTGQSILNYSDFSMRRMRMSARFVYDRHTIYTQFGLTSEAHYNPLSRGMFFHDLWYKFRYDEKNYIGAGKHMWNGLSRLSNVSYATQLVLDNPAFNFPNVNVDNDFVRQMGIFFNGQIGRFDYMLSVNQPLLPLNSTRLLNDQEIIDLGVQNLAYSRYHTKFNSKAYISYSFLNKEKVAQTPFKVMSYFGKQGDFLNLGVGYHYNPEASGFLDSSNQLLYKDQLALSVDLWYELALKDESAFTLYSALYYYDYGPNFLRTTGVMNGFASSGDGITPPQGPGISYYYFGTGSIAYLSASYIIPKSLFNSSKKLIPFGAVSFKSLEGLNDSSISYDLGAHYLLFGNNVKLSAQYSTRPIYSFENLNLIDYKGLFILELQAKF